MQVEFHGVSWSFVNDARGCSSCLLSVEYRMFIAIRHIIGAASYIQQVPGDDSWEVLHMFTSLVP